MSSQFTEEILKEYNILYEKNKNKSLNNEEKRHYENLEHILTIYKLIIKDEKSSSIYRNR